mmetsp:Transcript_298/g.723  ORF Transcript_298/g.723 Transcript_298/m.723 type:complete len:225 (+) Transcript_298:1317-1991(+)
MPRFAFGLCSRGDAVPSREGCRNGPLARFALTQPPNHQVQVLRREKGAYVEVADKLRCAKVHTDAPLKAEAEVLSGIPLEGAVDDAAVCVMQRCPEVRGRAIGRIGLDNDQLLILTLEGLKTFPQLLMACSLLLRGAHDQGHRSNRRRHDATWYPVRTRQEASLGERGALPWVEKALRARPKVLLPFRPVGGLKWLDDGSTRHLGASYSSAALPGARWATPRPS